MSELDKALDLRLRGFSFEEVYDRVGIAESVLKAYATSKGVRITYPRIQQHQIDYLRENYSHDELVDGYNYIMDTYPDVQAAKKAWEIEALGCKFGSYAPVFRVLLGNDEFEKLHRASRTRRMVERYGVEQPNQNPDIAAKMIASLRKTNQDRYGVDYPTQRPEVAKKVHDARQATMLEKYGAANSVQVPELREKIFASRVLNGTLNSSSGEEAIYVLLCEQFGADDVQRNVVIDNRYPYHVDFYIRSRDLFIEYNGDRCHMDCWFDESNPEHLELVEEWRNRARVVEAESGKTSRYTKYISTWTGSDVDKRTKAKDSGLNYLVFWDDRSLMKDGVSYPRLQDFHEWLADGCPDPQDWVREASSCHTY